MKKILLLTAFLIMQIGIFASTIDGFVNLEKQSNHSGVKVLFIAISLTAHTDSVITNTDGSYSINLQNGIYKILYIKEGFDTFKKDNYLVAGNTTLSLISLLYGPFKNLIGDISGSLSNDTIYLVTGDTKINNTDTLKIEAGTKIKFKGFYSLTINGTIIAKGTQNDKIIFTSGLSTPKKGDWNSINFAISSNPQSVFSNCIVEFGGLAEPDNVDNRYSMIYINSSLTIDSCIVRESATHAMYIFHGLPKITNCQVYNNNRSGMYSYEGGFIIKNNVVHNNGWQGIRNNYPNTEIIGNIVYQNNSGIICFNSAKVSKNTIFNNSGSGLDIGICTAFISNNTITGNTQDGIILHNSNNVVASSNIISNNQGYGINLYGTCTSITLKYNLINSNSNGIISNAPLGIGSIISKNSNGTDCDGYFNIFSKPLYESTIIDNPLFLHLQNGSPCINAGDPDLAKDEDNSIVDIGAYSRLESTNNIEDTKDGGNIYIYPNPSSDIIVVNNVSKIMNISIFDINGKVLNNLPLINNKINVSNLENGIYFIQFICDNKIQTVKFIKD